MTEKFSQRLKKISVQELINHSILESADNFNPDTQRGLCCPFCGSGHGDNHTGAGELDADNMFYCYACHNADNGGHKLSTIDLFMKARNINDFSEACTEMANEFGTNDLSTFTATKTKMKKKQDAELLKTIAEDIKRSQIYLADLPTNQRRGLTLETMTHFKFGYLKDWTHPNQRQQGYQGRKHLPHRRIIIPTSDTHYNAVMLSCDREESNKDFWKMHTTGIELFNASALSDSDIVIVVEGEIDTASIWQASNGKIAVVGAIGGNGNLLFDALEKQGIRDKKFLILFDNDAGQDNARKLLKRLIDTGYPAVSRIYDSAMNDNDRQSFTATKIDANSILQLKGNEFLNALTEKIIDDSREELAAVEKDIATENMYKAKIDQWEEFNGAINPETLPKIKDAAKYLKTLNAFTITADIVQSAKTRNAIALCKFYDCFSDASDYFFVKLDKAQKLARNAIKQMKDEGGDFVSDPPNELVALSKVSIKELKEKVATLVKNFNKHHEYFSTVEAQRRNREIAEKKQAEREAKYKIIEDKLKELKALPPSPERDAELIQIINTLCEWRRDRLGNPVAVKGTQANMDLIFNDPNLEQLIGYDEFQQADVLLKAPPWRPHAKKGDEWSDRDDAQLRAYLRRTYKEFSAEKIIFDSVTSFSDANSFHEVKDYFKNLPKWDGKPRAETFFIDWLGVADSKYVREVTIKWLTAAVARIFHPGCEFQWALVLHGKQKIGKGYILKRLGGGWYKAISDRVDDPHAVDTIKLVWIGEFKEMNGMRKADVNAIKDFIELPADTRRFAYARRAKTVLRHCVFAITVNDDNFLSDLTGNRRFLILHSNLPKFGYVKEVRGEKLSDDNVIAQIWAEVYEYYKKLFKDGFDEKKLELSSETEHMGEEIANTYINDNGLTGEIKAFLDRKIPQQIIWDLMTREDRRNFIAESKFAIARRDLEARFKSSSKKISAKRQAEFDAAISASDSVLLVEIRDKLTGESIQGIEFFGSVYRQHVCAAEINSEAFMPNDKRKSVMRIHEILNTIEGWHLGKRIQKAPAYGDQKNVFYRNEDNNPDNDDEDNDNDNTTTPTIEDEFNGKPLDGTDIMPDFDMSQWN